MRKGKIMGIKTSIIVRAEINNMSENAINKDGYLVVRRDEDASLWYYGLYDDEKTAQEVAIEIGNGFVLGVAQ